MATYNITYETWSYEDTTIGDTDNRGFELKNEPIEDLDDVIKDMQQLNNGEWSQHPITAENIQMGAWYTGEYDTDIRTGEVTYHSYHFEGLTKKQAQQLLDNV